MKASSRYAQSGVDIDAGDRAKDRIIRMVRETFTDRVLHRDGAFGGLYSLTDLPGKRPVLVSSVDGVGTKVKVASAYGYHAGIGMDLVNHCIDDLLACGATPLLFLDYFACHTLDESILVELVEGMTRACREASISLIGGETAQMSDVYAQGEYDLAGTIIGVVDEEAIIDGKSIQPGDRVVGFPSSGLHTNGYTLARSVLLNEAGYSLKDPLPATDQPLGETLLAPHRSYLHEFTRIRESCRIQGIAHITGGGFEGNIRRILPEGCRAIVRPSTWAVPPVFQAIQNAGPVEPSEMYRVFNMGIGMVFILRPDDAETVLSGFSEATVIGSIESGTGVELDWS